MITITIMIMTMITIMTTTITTEACLRLSGGSSPSLRGFAFSRAGL
jgi:hypothetical protein